MKCRDWAQDPGFWRREQKIGRDDDRSIGTELVQYYRYDVRCACKQARSHSAFSERRRLVPGINNLL